MAELQSGQTTLSKRAQTERVERRRRKDTSGTGSLSVPDQITQRLAAEGLEGRWINDIGTRLHDKTVNDDYDKVSDVAPVVVGTDKRSGQPILAHFCAKPKKFLDEDRRERLNQVAERERAIVGGKVSDSEGGDLNEGTYQPKSTRNRIGNITS